MFDTIKSVSDITHYIRDLFEHDVTLQDVSVRGEVSNMTQASSGHWYFTLKDSDAQIKCVMWRSNVAKQTTIPKEGDALEVHGRVSLYEPRGEYQLYADMIRPVGLGDLYQQFERLKAKLYDEGLFDADRKREHPAFPKKIGVVTSATAAAFQDILNVLRRRYPLVEVIISPTQVQGATAPPQIVKAINRLNKHTDVDIILLCRGGGSIEDLWAFNDEKVARAVFKSRVPIVTGVGHETDFTIVDFVADERAPTPSAAAELVTPDVSDMREQFGRLYEALIGLSYDQILNRRTKLESTQKTLGYVSPENTIRNMRQRIDDLNLRLTQQQKAQFDLRKERLISKTAALEAASPRAILRRGYAIVTREDGRRVISELDVKPGMELNVRLKDGEFTARVEEDTSGRPHQRSLF